MGTAASLSVERESCEQFGDRVEVTKSLPVESFGQDNTPSESVKNGQSRVGEKTLSSGSMSEEKVRSIPVTTTSCSKLSKSRRSLGSFLGFNKVKGDDGTHERSHSEGDCAVEPPEIQLERLAKKTNAQQQQMEKLKRESDYLRTSTTRWQNKSQEATQNEGRAKERAKALEDELEKEKKRFKSYKEEKEKEIKNLVKKVRELEKSLRSSGTSGDSSLYPERLIASLENDADVENLSLFKAPGTLMNEKVPDVNTVFPLLAQAMTKIKPPNKNQTFRFYLSSDREAKRDATFFMKVVVPELQQLCVENGKFLVVLESAASGDSKSEKKEENWELYLMSKCDLFFGMLGNIGNSYLLDKWKSSYHIFKTQQRPMFFCFNDAECNASGGTEVTHFLDSVGDETKVSFYTRAVSLVDENKDAIQEIVKKHFGVDEEADVKEHGSIDISNEELITDCESSLKQSDILRMLTVSAHNEVGLCKYYDPLDAYVSRVGPVPPLLVSGDAGSGKTTLLAKWISRQLASGENLVLYNFVSSTTNDVFTNPAHVMRRITSQLLGLFPCLCSMMQCDPVQCEEYFPKLLKTIPAKINTNIIIVIDSVDKLQNANMTHHLSWLNDLLPNTVRVILSATTGNEPSHWRTWETVSISPLTFEESCDVFVLCSRSPYLNRQNQEAGKLLNVLPENAVSSPLFLEMLSHEMSSVSNVSAEISKYSSCQNVVELTISVLKSLQESKGSIINEILALVCCSRSGLAEAELMEIFSLSWPEWEPLLKCLVYDRPILRDVNDLLVVSHELILKGILEHLNGEEILRQARGRLVNFYTNKLRNSGVSASVIDQLPWLLVQLDDKENLKKLVSRVDVFLMFVKRSLFSDLLAYWSFLNVESSTFGKTYMNAIRQKEGDAPYLEVAFRYEILGRFLKGIGEFSLAMKCLERALETKEMVLESDDPWVGQSLHHLADLYALLGNLESAEASYKQTLEINENTFGKYHLLVAKELECLAYVKKKQNKETACIELKRKAARIRRKHVLPKMSLFSSTSLDSRLIQVNNLGAERKTPETASSLHNLGVLLQMEKRYQDAETLFKKSLAMRESLLSRNDLVLTQSLDRLASLYFEQKMYSETIWHHERSLAIKRVNLDKCDPSLISTMNSLAIAFRRNGNLEGSESTYREVLMALKEKHSSKDPMIATALHNLAVVSSDQKKLSEALRLFEQALEIYEESLGSCHPKVAESLKNIAKVHLDLGNADEAAAYLLRSQQFEDVDLTSSSLNSSDTVSWLNNSTLELQDPFT